MRKYLLFIVEGKNDKIELQAMLRAYCPELVRDKYDDEYYVHNGDITTETDTSEKTIVGKLNKIILNWRQGGCKPYVKISPSDIAQIIHVVDTDGTFVPEDAIIETDECKVCYKENTIEYLDRNIIIGRNRKKAKVIRKLLTVKQIDNIPYTIFFASCNMDHVLFDVRDPQPKDKGSNARVFAMHCKNADYLKQSVFCVGTRSESTYEESWDEIQQSYNSLNRHSNLNIMLDSAAHNEY